MDLPEARRRKAVLFDFYEALLTPRQREVFVMHFMEDNSLAEIGEATGTTPQAVADMLKRVNGRLNHYDKLLGLVEKHEALQNAVAQIRLSLDGLEDAVSPHDPEIKSMISQIRVYLGTIVGD